MGSPFKNGYYFTVEKKRSTVHCSCYRNVKSRGQAARPRCMKIFPLEIRLPFDVKISKLLPLAGPVVRAGFLIGNEAAQRR